MTDEEYLEKNKTLAIYLAYPKDISKEAKFEYGPDGSDIWRVLVEFIDGEKHVMQYDFFSSHEHLIIGYANDFNPYWTNK